MGSLLAGLSWAQWLAIPIGVTSLAALVTWLRTLRARRAARPPSTPEAIRRHDAYLDALTRPARGRRRVEPGGRSAPGG